MVHVVRTNASQSGGGSRRIPRNQLVFPIDSTGGACSSTAGSGGGACSQCKAVHRVSEANAMAVGCGC
jgi:hypothetical protein